MGHRRKLPYEELKNLCLQNVIRVVISRIVWKRSDSDTELKFENMKVRLHLRKV
jgi:hypothetical protein